jgi:hypothetical protein
MYPDVAEVGAEAGLHETAGVTIERRPASGADDILDWRRLLFLERGSDGGVSGRLL